MLKFKEKHVSDGLRTLPSCLHLHYLIFQNVSEKIRVSKSSVDICSWTSVFFLRSTGIQLLESELWNLCNLAFPEIIFFEKYNCPTSQ